MTRFLREAAQADREAAVRVAEECHATGIQLLAESDPRCLVWVALSTAVMHAVEDEAGIFDAATDPVLDAAVVSANERRASAADEVMAVLAVVASRTFDRLTMEVGFELVRCCYPGYLPDAA